MRTTLPYASQAELFAMLRRRHGLIYYALHRRPSITESPEYRHWSVTQTEEYDFEQTIFARSRRMEKNRRYFFASFLALVVAINVVLVLAFLIA